MKKYLYISNYFEPNESSLAQCEFKTFFNCDFEHYHLSDLDFHFQRSVFIKDRILLLCQGKNIEELVSQLEKRHMYYEDFKIVYYKNRITHLDYQTSLSYAQRLSDPIDGSTNLSHPKIIFAYTLIEDIYYFGILESNKKWNQYEYKPHSYSHSLPVRIARSAINIGVGVNEKVRIIDPCCGVGTVVLEGLSMGFKIIGSDINRDISYKARLNLEYFGYDPKLISRKDIYDIREYYDLSIIDVPYGVYHYIPKEIQLALIKQSISISRRCVAITHLDFCDEYKKTGLQIEKLCYYRKGNFYRYLTVLKG